MASTAKLRFLSAFILVIPLLQKDCSCQSPWTYIDFQEVLQDI